MEANLKQIRKQRKYSKELKKQLVTRFEKGEFSVPQLGKLYGIYRHLKLGRLLLRC